MPDAETPSAPNSLTSGHSRTTLRSQRTQIHRVIPGSRTGAIVRPTPSRLFPVISRGHVASGTTPADEINQIEHCKYRPVCFVHLQVGEY